MSERVEISTPPRPPRVLVVDDHAETVELLGMLLRRRGFSVTLARSVNEALRAVESASFDVLVSDHELPDGTGEELLRRLPARPPLALQISGHAELPSDGAKTAVFDQHLCKPVDTKELVRLISATARTK